MALKEQINNDLKAALIGGNRFVGEVLRGLKATILDEEIAQNKRDGGLDEATIEKLIAREIKKRNESAIIYDAANRPELSANERAEAQTLSVYLPKQLSEEDIQIVINRVISELGSNGLSSMGLIIGAVKKELGTSADGAIIAKLVKAALN